MTHRNASAFGFAWYGVLALTLCFSATAIAQAPNHNWHEFYGGGSGDDIGYAAAEVSDWAYFIAGSTETMGLDAAGDVWLLKIGILGDTIWTKTYDGRGSRDAASAIQATPDGGCIMAGFITDTMGGGTNVYILKVDAQGNVQNEVSVGGDSWDQAYDIQPTSDGGYIVTGYTTHIPNPDILGDQVFLIKTDAMGNVEWSRSYGQEFQDYGRSVKQTPDGGYIIAGNTWTGYAGVGHSEMLLMKADANGAFEWWQEHGFAWNDFGYAVFVNDDGGYTVVGETEFGGPTQVDVYVVYTDASGNQVDWDRWGGNGVDYVRDAKRTPTHNIIVGGYTYSWTTGTDPDIYLVEIEKNGDTVWTQHYETGVQLREFGFGVIPTSDKGYLVVGRTDYNGLPEDDIYLLKVGGFIEPNVFRRSSLGLPVEHFIYVEDTMWVGFGGGGRAAAQSVVGVELLLDTLLHTSTGDLEITLSHLGVTDTIVYRAGGADTNFIGTRISDGATVPIADGSGPFTSLYKPYKPLSAFAGLDPEGAWVLGVTDVVAGNDGTLQAWGLNFNLDVAAGIEPRDATVPEEFTLHQNYPNPFNPETRIDIDLPEPAFVTLEIFDILGRKVVTLVNETLAAGSYKTDWNAADHPSGVYLYRVTRDGRQTVRKMLLVK